MGKKPFYHKDTSTKAYIYHAVLHMNVVWLIWNNPNEPMTCNVYIPFWPCQSPLIANYFCPLIIQYWSNTHCKGLVLSTGLSLRHVLLTIQDILYIWYWKKNNQDKDDCCRWSKFSRLESCSPYIAAEEVSLVEKKNLLPVLEHR